MSQFFSTFSALANTPTASYREHWMLEVLHGMLGAIPGLEVREDKYGNVAARIRRGQPEAPPVAFVAHLDHPGFVVNGSMNVDGNIPLLFEGGVNDEYFPGGHIRLFRSADDVGISATIVEMSAQEKKGDRNRHGFAKVNGDPEGAVLAMWDLAPFRVDGDLVHSRAVDDLGGCAMILEMLRRVAESEGPADVIGLFTTAEECGFRGALLLCRDAERERMLPNNSAVVSVETSSRRPHIPVGGGAVLRVGDATSVFDAALCHALAMASKTVFERTGVKQLRRALMDGGTCEATAFNLFGYQSAGVCIPLGNYHNMEPTRRRIAEEFFSLSDAESLIATMTELVLGGGLTSASHDELVAKMIDLAENACPRLQR